MEEEITKLTRKEALLQGYTKCGFDQRDWQMCMDIEDMTEADFETSMLTKIVVFSKESTHPDVSEERLREIVADQVSDSWCDETGDDTTGVLDAIKSVDFSGIHKLLTEALSEYQCWFATDIELIP